MKTNLMILTILTLALGLTAAASSGSFGEYASTNACHCLLFNATNTVNTWTLYSTFNTTVPFSVNVPNITGVSITTNVVNGNIPPNSLFPILVTVTSNSFSNISANITAYITAYANTGSSNASASIQLATSKLIKIEGNANAVTTTTTTTIPQSSGGGGATGVSGGGSELPTITSIGSCRIIQNFTNPKTVNVTFNGVKYNITDNFISPESAGLTIGNKNYTVEVGETYNVIYTPAVISLKLLNVSYLPVLHTIELSLCSNTANNTISNTISTTSTATTTSTSIATTSSPSTIPMTTIKPTITIMPLKSNITASNTAASQAGPSQNDQAIAVGVIAVVLMAILFFWVFKKPSHPAPSTDAKGMVQL